MLANNFKFLAWEVFVVVLVMKNVARLIIAQVSFNCNAQEGGKPGQKGELAVGLKPVCLP